MADRFNIELNKMNDYTDHFTDYVKELQSRAVDKNLEEFAEMRRFPMEEIKASDIFYIGDATEMLIPKYLGMVDDFGIISPTNRKPIFHNRYVIPIKDTDGRILNLVGYSRDADERYVYGTARYYRRRDTMYGLENLELAYDLGYAIVEEGITDAIRVRSLGHKNSFAMCGTHHSDFIMKQLNRCKYGVIRIPDRDAPGRRAVQGWKCNRGITLNIFIKYKDVDAMCKDSDDNIAWVEEYISTCIEWLKGKDNNRFNAESQEITMN